MAENSTNTVLANSQTAPDAAAVELTEDDAQLAALKKSVSDVEVKAAAISHAAQQSTPSGWWTTHSAMTMSASVLLFGAAVIAIATFTAKKQQSTLEEALRLYGTIMVITMAVFLVVAGYSDQQIAAPLGLLGTIAGYLLGRTTKPNDHA